MLLKKIKKRLIAGVGLTILSSCTHYIYIYKSQWTTSTVIVDGKSSEWSIPLKFYDDKSKLQYAIANDNENLYVCIRATDEATQRKIYAAGMQVILDTAENKSKDNPLPPYILFPMGGMRKSMNPGSEAPPSQDFKFSKPVFELKIMEISGFHSPLNDGIFPIQNNSDIKVNINSDSNRVLVYELAVPFKAFYKNSISQSDSSKIISVSIVLNALPAPSEGMPGGGGPPGGGPPGGGRMGGGQMGDVSGGGMGGGGMGGGMPGGPGGNTDGGMEAGGNGEVPSGNNGAGMPSREYMFEKNTIKTQFQLAIKR